MPTPLQSAIERLTQISGQGFSDMRNLMQSVLAVQLGGTPHAIPIPSVLPASTPGAGGPGQQQPGGGGGGSPSPLQHLGIFAGGLARRYAPRLAFHLQSGFQLAKIAGGLAQSIGLGGAGIAGAGAAGGGVPAGSAGAGAAGVTGAAAGAAGAGGVAALASNPVGWAVLAVAAITAVAVAFASLPKAMEGFGQSLLDANKHLAQFSASMAAVFLRQQVRDIVRDVQIGGATAGSAQRLADALANLKDTNRDLTIAWANLKNDVGTTLIRLVDPLARALQGIIAWLEKHNWLEKSDTSEVPFQTVLVDYAKEVASKRAANDARFARNPFER